MAGAACGGTGGMATGVTAGVGGGGGGGGAAAAGASAAGVGAALAATAEETERKQQHDEFSSNGSQNSHIASVHSQCSLITFSILRLYPFR